MTDPEIADAHLRRAAHAPRCSTRCSSARSRDAILPTARRPDRAQPGDRGRASRACSSSHGVELIGAKLDAIEMAEDRELFKQAMARDRPRRARARATCRSMADARGCIDEIGFPAILRPSASRMGGSGGGIAYNRERVRRAASQFGARPVAGHEVLIEQSRARLEGVRARGHARRQGQRRHHLLDRELRPDGRAHRRLDHGGAGADADRQGVPAHARRRDRDHARDRRRPPAARNIQFAVDPRDRPRCS